MNSFALAVASTLVKNGNNLPTLRLDNHFSSCKRNQGDLVVIHTLDVDASIRSLVNNANGLAGNTTVGAMIN